MELVRFFSLATTLVLPLLAINVHKSKAKPISWYSLQVPSTKHVIESWINWGGSEVVVVVVVGGRRRSHRRWRGWRGIKEQRWWWWKLLGRRTLVTLGEKSKCINLVNEIDHTCPTTKSKSNNQYPNNYKNINHIGPNPSSHELRWLLHSILQ